MASDGQKETEAQPQQQTQTINKNQKNQSQSTTTATTTTAATSTPSTQTSTISSELVAVTNAIKEKKKIIRRAFSMPRNPFRLSKRVKITNATNKSTSMDTTTTKATMSNGCHQSVQTNSDDDELNAMKTVILQHKNNTLPSTLTEHETAKATVNGKIAQSLTEMSDSEQQQQQKDSKYRMFRRSAWKKFLSRIAQQMTSSNIGVSTNTL